MTAHAFTHPTSPAGNPLGDILSRTAGLTADQVQQVLDHQRDHGGRFGEAVVALGLARHEDVVWALSQQFHYPYLPLDERDVSEELVVANQPFADHVERFRELRSQLLLGAMAPQQGQHALAILSAEKGAGKTFIAANLAVAFSQLAGRTLLIDADLRNARLHDVFGVESSPGLSGILAGRCEANVITPVKRLPNLFLLPAGVRSPNPTELLHRASFGLLIRDLLNSFDHVLIDTPAASLGADARIIANHCGAAMLIGSKGQSQLPPLQKLVKQLTSSQVKIAGVLVNEHRN